MNNLIKDTTKEERIKYIENMFACHHGDCENCGVCHIFKGKLPVDVFYDYIEGKREFQDILKEWNQRY